MANLRDGTTELMPRAELIFFMFPMAVKYVAPKYWFWFISARNASCSIGLVQMEKKMWHDDTIWKTILKQKIRKIFTYLYEISTAKIPKLNLK